jgi:hypothetical protein
MSGIAYSKITNTQMLQYIACVPNLLSVQLSPGLDRSQKLFVFI